MLFMSLGLFQSLKCLNNVKKISEPHLYKNMLYSIVVQLWFIIYGFSGNGIYDTNVTFLYITAVSIMISTKIYLRKKSIERRNTKCTSGIN